MERHHSIYKIDLSFSTSCDLRYGYCLHWLLARYIAKKLLRCKLITDTGDVAYELAKSTGNYSKIQLAMIHWIEQMAIKNSDCLIV
jgi:hypothetical protein